MPPAIKSARAMALKVLLEGGKGSSYPEDLMGPGKALSQDMPERERNLATQLVYGTLRWRGRLDYILSLHSHLPLKKLNPEVLWLLRLSAFQFLSLDRIPSRAAVNEAVELAKKKGRPPWITGYLNALLRKVADSFKEGEIPFPEDPVENLVVQESFPAWMVHDWSQNYGWDKTRALCQALNQIPPLTVRVNLNRISREALVEHLKGWCRGEMRVGAYAPESLVLNHIKGPPWSLPGYKEGWFQVQDEGSQLISRLLSPKKGEKILDACAGEGGKTGHLGQLMGTGETLWALDQGEEKLKNNLMNLKRLGISGVKFLHHDLTFPLDGFEGFFDRILLDAPCTGLGTIRRRPDIKWNRSPQDKVRLAGRQYQMINNLMPLLKRGGLLVYATCTLGTEENDRVVERALREIKGLKLELAWEEFPPAKALGDEKGYFRPFPGEAGMDGFFAVRIRKA